MGKAGKITFDCGKVSISISDFFKSLACKIRVLDQRICVIFTDGSGCKFAFVNEIFLSFTEAGNNNFRVFLSLGEQFGPVRFKINVQP